GATKASLSLFGIDPAGRPMEEVLQLGRREQEGFSKWLNHVFSGIVPFKDLISLGPKKFEKQGKVVSLDYRPIVEDKKLHQIICIATDVTENVRLEKQALLEKEKAQRLTNILDRPLEFTDLMSDFEEAVNFYLSNRGQKTEDIFRAFHTLKAGFGSYKVSEIVEDIHNLESYLNEVGDNWTEYNKNRLHSILEKMNLSRLGFLRENRKLLGLANSSVNSDTGGDMKLLIKKIQSAIGSFNQEFILKEVSTLFMQFISPTKELAKQQDKLVDIKVQESDIFLDPQDYKELFKSLLHIFRNSVDHGIESREERVAKNKSEIAKLKVFFLRED
ncbi:MAG: hypothetical protein VYD54_00205, partial [Bdellovibrionota bacterium]|nr:hypothetical protein [Bdellovibrionota bacterium]